MGQREVRVGLAVAVGGGQPLAALHLDRVLDLRERGPRLRVYLRHGAQEKWTLMLAALTAWSES